MSSLMKWEHVWASMDWERNEAQHLENTLNQRTEKYARPADPDALEASDMLKALVFVQGSERYAVPVQYVVRGVAQPNITHLPCVPPYYRGVINVRGRILSVLDLRRFWRISSEEEQTQPRLIVIRAGQLEFALQADDVVEVARISLSHIVPPMTAGIGLDHVQGICADGMVIVDVESLVTDERLFVTEELK